MERRGEGGRERGREEREGEEQEPKITSFSSPFLFFVFL